MTTQREMTKRIRRLQQKLHAGGFYTGAIDGRFGPLTAQALAASRQWAVDHPSSPQRKGLTIMNFLTGYRTYIIAAAMLLTGLAGVLGIDIPSFSGQAPGNLVLEALAFFFLRQGLKVK